METSERLELQERIESIKTHRLNRRIAIYKSALLTIVTLVAIAKLFF